MNDASSRWPHDDRPDHGPGTRWGANLRAQNHPAEILRECTLSDQSDAGALRRAFFAWETIFWENTKKWFVGTLSENFP